jgi:alanine-alpha-ketoisovalerate/valine-pyruvate aminotransferase
VQATFKIENDFNGQTKNPSTKEFYLEKYGLKLGKQDLAFGMPRSNFNILDVESCFTNNIILSMSKTK